MKLSKLNSRNRIAEPKSNGLQKKIIKLDLSYGDMPPQLVAQGYVRRDLGMTFGVPYIIGVHIWPIESECVEEAYCAFGFNRIPGKDRPKWMDELWRVLVPGGKATIIVPYWTSQRSIQDPLSEWPPFCEQSFLYFNRKFREDNRQYAEWKSNFDFVYGYTLDQETTLRTDDTRPFWIKHYIGAVQDLQIVLTKLP